MLPYKLTALILIASATLAGCFPTIEYGDFRAFKATPKTKEQTGYWTLNNHTFYLGKNGEGFACTGMAQASIERYKMAEDDQMTQIGYRTDAPKWKDNTWVYDYAMTEKLSYRPDPDLNLATPSCKKAIEELMAP